MNMVENDSRQSFLCGLMVVRSSQVNRTETAHSPFQSLCSRVAIAGQWTHRGLRPVISGVPVVLWTIRTLSARMAKCRRNPKLFPHPR